MLFRSSHTSIFYESPHRIVKTVQALAALDPDIPVCVARELTKTFETYHRGPASRLAAEFAERPPKGEIVLLVGGVNALFLVDVTYPEELFIADNN